MANYTPDSPYVLGEEWVPIKSTPYTLNVTEEQGHSFSLSAAATIVTGRFYTQDPPVVVIPGLDNNPSAIMAVYPKGMEDQTGPVKSVTIPCNGGVISGDTSFLGATTVEEALGRIGDNRKIQSNFTSPGVSSLGNIDMNFAVNSFPELVGKRILKLELVYSLIQNGVDPNNDLLIISQITDTPVASVFLVGTDVILSKAGTGTTSTFSTAPSIELPRYNQIYDVATIPSVGGTVFPWTPERLQYFDANSIATNKQYIGLFFSFPDGSIPGIVLDYAALRVTYCEEQRVAFGGTFGYIRPDSSSLELRGLNLAPGGVILPAGDYTVTIEGDGEQTDLYALTELYPMRDQPGITVKRTTKVGSTFTAVASRVLPQLSLHTATSSVADVHGYGRQVQAPVNSSISAQTITINGATGSYPWARFYARRFGDTVQPLTISSVATPAITASISVEEFDALTEIVDGWKEVTLRLDTAAAFTNSGTGQSFQWTSNETAGSSWEVLGASAYVKNGSLPLVQITGAHSLDATTYGGTTAFMTWNGTADSTSDGVLMFAQEMPAVSGLTVLASSLAVTGVGLDCGVPPECIPTGISYNEITWNALDASSMAASGFGYYELQRSDTVEDEWNTILHANSPLVTGFSDYEARIGIESSYRIRFVHRLLFESSWSAEVTSTLPGPGVTGNQVGNSAIVFSTNEVQDGGSSLAYTLVWDSTPDESFTFIEAGDVQLQQMYLRDFQVAFRPLERGGERFQRTLLVQAAAVPSGLIRDGFKSLRDLAWDDVSYVCVRNELGDRWYATVLVPSGNVIRNRRLYLAQIDIIEVTDTPSVINLPEGSGTGDGALGGACFAPALWDENPGWDYGCWT